MTRYLVTGGAGFIGSSIAASLLARGDAVTVLDDFSSGREANLAGLHGDIEVVRGDVSVATDVERAMRGVDGVFHEAAMASVPQSIAEPLRCDEVNVRGTLLVLETARQQGVRRVVFAASAAAYGDEPTQPKSEVMRPEPLSPYAVSKVAGEHYVRVYALLHGMKTLSLRYFNVFGPRQDPKSQYAAAIPRFVEALRTGKRPTVFGDGLQTRDFCSIENVVDANLRAMAAETAAGEVVNVATGQSVTVLELLTILSQVLDVPVDPAFVAERAGDIKHSAADITRAREQLGYEPLVDVETGLRRMLRGEAA